MEGFTIIDGIVALVIVLSALLAYSRGLVREALAIGGWIVAAVVAFLFAPQVEPLVKEVPVISDLVGDNCELALIVGAGAVFAVALIAMSLITPVFSSIVQRSAVGGIDQGLGFLFGVARGILLVAIAYFVYDTVASAQQLAIIDDSRSARVFSELTGRVEEGDPERALGWVTTKMEELTSHCTGGESPT